MVKESDFKSKFLKKVKKELKPLYVLQYKQDSTTVASFPDTIVIFEGITIFIEFKASKTAKFRPGQKETIKNLNDHSHIALVCYPENQEEVMEELRRTA